MYFFAESSGTITQDAPLGSWDVAGYQQINVYAWVQGGSGTVAMELYFNGYSAVQETLRIGPVNWRGVSTAILTRTYPVYAPTLSIVLYNASTQMDFTVRVYAACCEPPQGLLARLFRARPARDGEPHRKLSEDVDIDALHRAPDQPASAT